MVNHTIKIFPKMLQDICLPILWTQDINPQQPSMRLVDKNETMIGN